MVADRATGEECDYAMTQVHTMFSELGWWLRLKDSREVVSDELLGSLTEEARKFKSLEK